jgi:hypothetical protein
MNAINSLTLEVFNMKLRKTLTTRDLEHMEAEDLKSMRSRKQMEEAADFEDLATHKTHNNTRIRQKKENPQ